MVKLSDGEKNLRICITVYTQYRHVTDGRTDGQTDNCYGIVRAMHTRRAVKSSDFDEITKMKISKIYDGGRPPF